MTNILAKNSDVKILPWCLLGLRQIGVSNGTGQSNFSGQRTKVSSLSQDKGTIGQAKNFTKERAGTAKIWDGTGRDSQNPGQDTGQNGTE